MSAAGMAMILKRLLILGLMLAVIVGVTAEVVPCGMGQFGMTVRADMSDGCSGAKSPSTDHMPTCIEHVGCIAISGIPASPALIVAASEWASPTYVSATAMLSGISIEPELSPPILPA